MSTVAVRDLISSGVLRIEDGNHGNDRPRPAEFADQGVAFIRAADMTSGIVDFEGAGKISPVAMARIRKGVGAGGDVLLSHKGTVGRIAVAPANAPEFVCSPQTTFWRSLDPSRLDPTYLRYAMLGAPFQRQLATLAGQTDMAPYVSLTDQRSMTLDVPTIGDQRAIAEVLGALDDKIAANASASALADDLARSRYHLHVASRPTRRMSDVLVPLLGGTPSRSNLGFWDGAVPWVSAKDVTGASHGVIRATSEGISRSATTVARLHPLPVGSVVLTARGTVGRVARLDVAAAINQSCYGFVPGKLPAGALRFVVEAASDQARALAHGSVFDTITMRTFDHVLIPDLTDDEWNGVEGDVRPLLGLVSGLVRENSVLVTTRDELLPLLMSGKVRVRDAEKRVEEVL